jgi:hypothetical protein
MKTSESSRQQLEGLPVLRRNVAGIDLGSEQHWVCAPTLDGNGRERASFGATTPELIGMAEWLKARQVESVAIRLRVDSAAAQLRIAAGFVPTGGSGLHAADAGAG